VAASLLMSLLGILTGIWAEKFDHLSAVTNFIVTPLSFLSGTFYSTTRLPEIWQQVAHLNPFFYMIDGFRYGFIGRADASVWIGVAVMLAVDCALLFADLGFAHPWALIAFAALGMALHSLIGILVGIWAEKWDHYSAMHTFLLVPLSFLSGVFYPVQALPAPAQAVMDWNPIFHIIDGFRFGISGVSAADPATSLAILVGVDLALGLLAYRWFRSGYKLKP
jgi:ABC-type polysaccharide/polyol phosphate export permease